MKVKLNVLFLILGICFCNEKVLFAATEHKEGGEAIDLSKIYAVHAMHRLPVDGILRAGAVARKDSPEYSLEKGDPLPGVAGWRPTLHFSLGKIANNISTAGLDISNRPFVVLIPLSELLNQLIGLSIEDTFILGDLKIPNNSILMVDESKEVEAKLLDWVKELTETQIKIKPPTKKMSAEVLKAIQDFGGLVAPIPALAGLVSSFDKDKLFTQIMGTHPYVMETEHQHHPVGKMEQGRTGALYMALGDRAKNPSDRGVSLKNLSQFRSLNHWGEISRHYDEYKVRLPSDSLVLRWLDFYWSSLQSNAKSEVGTRSLLYLKGAYLK